MLFDGSHDQGLVKQPATGTFAKFHHWQKLVLQSAKKMMTRDAKEILIEMQKLTMAGTKILMGVVQSFDHSGKNSDAGGKN